MIRNSVANWEKSQLVSSPLWPPLTSKGPMTSDLRTEIKTWTPEIYQVWFRSFYYFVDEGDQIQANGGVWTIFR